MQNTLYTFTLNIAVIAALLLLPVQAVGQDHLSEDFMKAARTADILILGEVHDNPRHHEIQAQVAGALQPAALVFEMIPKTQEAEVNRLRQAGATRAELASALDWENSGWPDFAFYAKILEAAPEARVIGGEQPIEEVRKAMSEGAAQVFGSEASTYGLDEPLESHVQEAREQRQYSAHCEAIPMEMLPGLVEAQRFRDAGLADATLRARAATDDGLVVVITGNGHANLDSGLPEALRFAAPELEVVSLGQLEAEPDSNAPPPYDFHHVSAPPPDRPDPCAEFSESAD
ncbi:ChaN family lipoprotein [Fodinicurvata fenggangensis]|uniref:ChaN family lipoprotein n=1 Tax=Fodinicurvata fenggangensis TaxID=1121830 RepID=UPI00054D6BB1|nr:ChaN family lipoprotein [Fodinicurvata fenggangensis]